MNIQYYESGDYYLPDLNLQELGPFPIGKYGRMRKQYLKEYRPILCCNLLLSERLYQHLAEINQSCVERMELLIRQMADREGVTEALKAADQFEWVRRMNSIQSRAEEIMLNELVYC